MAGREKIEFGNRVVSTSAPSGSRRGGGGKAVPAAAAGRESLRRPCVSLPVRSPSRLPPERGSPGCSAHGQRPCPAFPNPAAPRSVSRLARGREAEGEGRAGEQSRAHLRARRRIGSVSRRAPWDMGRGPRACGAAGWRSGTARRARSRNLFWPLGRAVISRFPRQSFC